MSPLEKRARIANDLRSSYGNDGGYGGAFCRIARIIDADMPDFDVTERNVRSVMSELAALIYPSCQFKPVRIENTPDNRALDRCSACGQLHPHGADYICCPTCGAHIVR